MQASAGDRLRVRGKKVGSPDTEGQIIEVRGQDGQPPYMVRFDNGHERLVVPGSDCQIVKTAGAQR